MQNTGCPRKRDHIRDLNLCYCSFDMFASHGRWNGSLLKSLIPDAFSVTILRRPNETFESLFSYTGLAKKLQMNVNQFAEALVNDRKVIKGREG